MRRAPAILAGFVLAWTRAAGDPAADGVVRLPPLTVEAVLEQGGADARDRTDAAGAGLGAASSAPTLRAAAAWLPGLVVQDGFGGFDPPRVAARGSGLQSAPVNRGLLWTLDGAPLAAADGSFNAAVVEASLLAEIGHAPAAADPIAAGVALGGTLALRSAGDAGPGRGTLTMGSHDFVRAAATGRMTLGNFAAWVGAAFTRSGGWRMHSAQVRPTVAASLSRPAGRGPLVRVSVLATAPEFDVPGPLTLAAAAATPAGISAGTAADRPRRETRYGRAVAEVLWNERPDTLVAAAVSAQSTRDWFRQLRANGLSETRGEDFSARLDFRREAGLRVWRGGVQTVWGARDQQRWANLAGAAGPRFAANRLRARTTAAWLDDRWRLGDRWELAVGATWSEAMRSSAGTTAGGRVRAAGWAPRAMATWRPGDGWVLFGRASRGREAPGWDDLLAVRGTAPNLALTWSPLRAQRADTIEAGARWTRPEGRLAAGVTVYAADWDGELLRLADAAGAARGTVNAGPTRHRGVEAALDWRWTEAWLVRATQTWSAARFVRDPVYADRRLAGLPPGAGAAEIAYEPKRGPVAAAGASWITGTTFADHANRLGYPGHTLAHARAGWRGGRWGAMVEVRNALDRRHVASTAGVVDLARNPAATALFLPGSPRSVFGSFEWRW